jgi:GT2 family glycosyltransferase
MIFNLYIIIVTYNGKPWIEKCLASCGSNPVVMIDNNSKDDTVDFVKENFPSVIILEQEENLGFGAANNLGMRYALDHKADAVFLLNQDAYLRPGCLQNLWKTHQEFPAYGLLSPIHLNGDGTRLDHNFSNYVNYNSNADFYGDSILQKLKRIYEVPFVNAAGWFLPRQTLLSIGGFDPMFYHYGEDDHYCQRLRYHNLKIGVVPDTYLLHDRENRKNQAVIMFTPSYYKQEERFFKNQFGNLNLKQAEVHWMNLKKSNKKKIIRSFIKGKFSISRAFTKLLRLRRQWWKQCQESKERLCTLDNHYL